MAAYRAILSITRYIEIGINVDVRMRRKTTYFIQLDVYGSRFCYPDAMNLCVDISTGSNNVTFNVEASADIG